MAAFTAEQRTKEIGVRKVLGASVSTITGMLSADFLKLVLIAIVLASPIAWYAMNRWLQDFAYKIDLEWWMFALATSIGRRHCPANGEHPKHQSGVGQSGEEFAQRIIVLGYFLGRCSKKSAA